MNIQLGYIIGLVCGLVGLGVGVVYYRRGGKGLMFLGAAVVIGPLAPLLSGRISEEAQIAMSVVSIILTIVGVSLGVLDVRARQRRAI
jgi:TM2 domain-containing membrane protein YozV